MTIPLVPEWRPELDEPSGNWTIQVTTRLELAEGELLDLCANLHGPVVTYLGDDRQELIIRWTVASTSPWHIIQRLMFRFHQWFTEHRKVVTYAQIELQAAPPDADIDTWLEGVLGRAD
jgi:hypothetical protein